MPFNLRGPIYLKIEEVAEEGGRKKGRDCCYTSSTILSVPFNSNYGFKRLGEYLVS
jgi:hypothetical protein